MLAAALLMISCGGSGGNNAPANNKPANAANTATAPVADPKADEAEIRRIMADAAVALGKNDADAMAKIYADNYKLVNIDGSVQDRNARLEALRSGDVKYSAFSYSDADIRINPEGNGAIVIAKLAMKGTSKGKSIDGDYRVTQVYSKTKDGWKQVGAQATKIEAGATAKEPPAKTDPADKMPEKAPPAAPANK
jgi:ketosteroid isomerase-like protein